MNERAISNCGAAITVSAIYFISTADVGLILSFGPLLIFASGIALAYFKFKWLAVSSLLTSIVVSVAAYLNSPFALLDYVFVSALLFFSASAIYYSNSKKSLGNISHGT